MASKRFNGGIIGVRNLVTVDSTVGIWSPAEIQLSRLSKVWPDPGDIGVQVFNNTSTWAAPGSVDFVQYLVVAGGGGGGQGGVGGGGGAGGLRTGILSLTQNQTYTITVGAGGAAGTEFQFANRIPCSTAAICSPSVAC